MFRMDAQSLSGYIHVTDGLLRNRTTCCITGQEVLAPPLCAWTNNLGRGNEVLNGR